MRSFAVICPLYAGKLKAGDRLGVLAAMLNFTGRSSSTGKGETATSESIRAIAYSMDTLIPGLYIWFGPVTLMLGGSLPDDEPYRYPGTLHSRAGIALVLPNYRIFTTYHGSYDPRQASD